MLISSSFLANAAWHTEQVADSAEIAAQLFSNPGQAQPAPTAVPKPAAAPQHGSATAAGSEQSINKNDRTDSTNEAHNGAQVKTGGHRERRVHRRGAGAANRMDGGAAQNTPDSNNAKDTARTPFLAVLDDVLPSRGGASGQQSGTSDPAGGVNAAPVANATLPNAALGGDSANLPEAPVPGTSVPNTATPPGVVHPDNSGNHAAATPQAIRGIPQGPQVELPTEIDAAFEIRREISATQGPVASKPGVRGDVAFTARVTERTPQPQAFSLNDAQAAIAASRFGGLNTGASSGNGKAGPGATRITSQGNGAARAETATFSPAGASGDAGDGADLHIPGGAQNAVEQAGAPANASHEASAAIEPGASGQARAAATTENLTAGTAAAAGSNSSARSSSAAKAAESDRAPQLMEPQEENAKPSGESVHDISLRLTAKDQNPVQVRLMERGGELHVSVRTQDAGLTHGLRDGLSDLVGRLEHSGYRAETWQPSDNRQGSGNDPGRDGGSQKNSGQNGGSGSGAKQQNPRDDQQQNRQGQQWLSEMEANLQRSKTWQPASTR